MDRLSVCISCFTGSAKCRGTQRNNWSAKILLISLVTQSFLIGSDVSVNALSLYAPAVKLFNRLTHRNDHLNNGSPFGAPSMYGASSLSNNQMNQLNQLNQLQAATGSANGLAAPSISPSQGSSSSLGSIGTGSSSQNGNSGGLSQYTAGLDSLGMDSSLSNQLLSNNIGGNSNAGPIPGFGSMVGLQPSGSTSSSSSYFPTGLGSGSLVNPNFFSGITNAGSNVSTWVRSSFSNSWNSMKGLLSRMRQRVFNVLPSWAG